MRIAWKIGVVLTLVVSGPAAAEANGVIKEDYKSPSGNRPEMSGNAKNRHLEVYSNERGCWWHLMSVK